MCHDWAFKHFKVQPEFQFSPENEKDSRQCCLCSLSAAPLLGVQVA